MTDHSGQYMKRIMYKICLSLAIPIDRVSRLPTSYRGRNRPARASSRVTSAGSMKA